jgi:2-oxoglutarate ferredoxin oxidoreductase subunit beta
MPSIAKPKLTHPALEPNSIGLSLRDYEGVMSTLCAGCGHDSITAALTYALWELAIPRHMIAKLSGIGCSAKTAAYFVRGAHGFNGAHGRMPPVATGAQAANRDLVCIGISGDGDSLSIGLGHLGHLIRRNVRMLYVLENNGVYGLTKGQFSASADVGSTTKRGEPNQLQPIDPILFGLSLGATFLARSFSGDKRQLVPLLEAGLTHRGLAIVDVISPCVTFNDHEGSTKSYLFTRQHDVQVTVTDFVAPESEISATIPMQGVVSITMHDGATLRFRSVPEGYDPTNRTAVVQHMQAAQGRGEILTGLLYVDESAPELHDVNRTSEVPLAHIPYEQLTPGAGELRKLGFR